MIRQTRRSGVTLVEVLAATAILAIGLLSIMALFPIGAVSMARAINQNRAADHAQNSDALFRLYWKRAWLDPTGGGRRTLAQARQAEPMMVFLDTSPTGLTIPATSSQPSFPVLVDPIGYRTQLQNGAAYRTYVAGNSNLPVRTILAATAVPDNAYPLRPTLRNTTLQDDLTYDENGEATDLGSGQLQRVGRYNVAWLIQRPKNNVPEEVSLTILVFAGRSPTDTPSSELYFPAVASAYGPQLEPKPRSVVMSLNGQSRPPVLKGKWVAFSTTIQPVGGVPYTSLDFYRIAAVTDIDDNTLSLELEQPLRSYDVATLPNWKPTSANPVYGDLSGLVVVFDNLFEVFERGTVSATGIAGR